jgi:hypothetical protein
MKRKHAKALKPTHSPRIEFPDRKISDEVHYIKNALPKNMIQQLCSKPQKGHFTLQNIKPSFKCMGEKKKHRPFSLIRLFRFNNESLLSIFTTESEPLIKKVFFCHTGEQDEFHQFFQTRATFHKAITACIFKEKNSNGFSEV